MQTAQPVKVEQRDKTYGWDGDVWWEMDDTNTGLWWWWKQGHGWGRWKDTTELWHVFNLCLRRLMFVNNISLKPVEAQ